MKRITMNYTKTAIVTLYMAKVNKNFVQHCWPDFVSFGIFITVSFALTEVYMLTETASKLLVLHSFKTESTVFTRPYLVQSRLCYSVASVVVVCDVMYCG